MPQVIECSSCSKPKSELKRQKSKLQPSMTLNMCRECIAFKREPRYIIVLTAQQAGGTEKIIPYVKEYRYCGPKIELAEAL